MERRVKDADLKTALVPLEGGAHDDDTLFELIGDAPLVLIGEATHGTHEFYRARAEITKRLIDRMNFGAVCIEGDWPNAYRVNRYVRGTGDDLEAVESLAEFKRFPAWMWRNAEVLDFIAWLRDFNDRCQDARRPKAGFYGLDLYSMYASIDAVLRYLDAVDAHAAARARERYACLEAYQEHPERYGVATGYGLHPSCRSEVLSQLLEIQRHASTYARLDGKVAADEYFYAEQNARIVAAAEQYYGAMVDDTISTWNLRDEHMFDTFGRLLGHLARQQGPTKAVLWAHNSHVGNAAATSMSLRKETNIGEIARETYGEHCVSIGFTTNTGTVTAASDWHAPEERKRVRPARPDSYEYLFHESAVPRFLLPARRHRAGVRGLPRVARELAIGVIYRPETELQSHYFHASILEQFDAIYHFDTTRALEPLERTELWISGEPPETYPAGV